MYIIYIHRSESSSTSYSGAKNREKQNEKERNNK